MTAASAFTATYSDFRIVKGRKCAQIVLEVPIEAADAALAALGGVPRSDAETWVGVARIDPKAAAALAKPEPAETDKQRRKWRELRPSQQAAMRCQELAFRRFMRERDNCTEPGEVENAVRNICGVNSRADILEGTNAAQKWARLDSEFLAWREVG